MSYKLLIDGELIDGARSVGVINPATAAEFETAPRADAAIAMRAIEAAKKAFPSWAALSYEHRSGYVEAFAAAVEAREGDFSRLLTLEQGKPLPQAQAEIRGSVAALRFFASQELKPRVIRDNEREYIVEQRYPQGVVAAIAPWNFPVSLLIYKVGAALMTGNPVIAKPAPTTPLTTLLLGELAAAIFPNGVFQTLADTNDLGPLLTSHEDIAHVSFTGSTPTGKKVLESTVSTLKRFTLELGGNDAAIVLDDVDIDKVAPAIFRAATLNAGQFCFATKRVYAPSKLIEPLTEALVALAKDAKVGTAWSREPRLVPSKTRCSLINSRALSRTRVGMAGSSSAGTELKATAISLSRQSCAICPTTRVSSRKSNLDLFSQFSPMTRSKRRSNKRTVSSSALAV